MEMELKEMEEQTIALGQQKTSLEQQVSDMEAARVVAEVKKKKELYNVLSPITDFSLKQTNNEWSKHIAQTMFRQFCLKLALSIVSCCFS